jgi:hypothetical protein
MGPVSGDARIMENKDLSWVEKKPAPGMARVFQVFRIL